MELLKRCNDQSVPMDDDVEKQALAKYKAIGLDPKSADFIGERLFRLVEMRLKVKGTRYYLVFSPWFEVWLKFGKFKTVFSADIDPWVSWQSHEDIKNFLSKSYADDAKRSASPMPCTRSSTRSSRTARRRTSTPARMTARCSPTSRSGRV